MILKVNSPQIDILFTVGFRKIVRRHRKISHLTCFYINLTYNHPLFSTGACPSILMESRCPLILIVIQVAIDTLLSRRTSVIYLSCTGHTSWYEGNDIRSRVTPTNQTNQANQTNQTNQANQTNQPWTTDIHEQRVSMNNGSLPEA